MFALQNKVAIVTGGGGILGQEFCRVLAEAGARVAIVDVSYESAQQCANHIQQELPKAEIFPISCDITDKASVIEMVNTVKDRFHDIHILLNNAATKTNDLKKFFTPFEDYDLATWREVMSVNLDGMFLVAQAVGKEMVRQGAGGSIIQTASIYGVVAPDQAIYEGSEYMGVGINTPAVYSASKAGVIGLTKYLASYWASHNIRVNAITPGGVSSGQNSTFTQKYSQKVPLKRMAQKAELGGAVLFLASPASSYVTGQNIIVDGGLTCW